MRTFEDYLREQHTKNYVCRATPDTFDNWLEQFDANDILIMVKTYEHSDHEHIDVGDSDHVAMRCIPNE